MLITMSEKDIHRFKVFTDVREKRLRQHAARGRPSNRCYSELKYRNLFVSITLTSHQRSLWKN
ncbi:hypothetical protein BCU97_19720 [Vibrio splendidus]|nr:hypothetical protein BCU97_19720 [Vibrio splendidus]